MSFRGVTITLSIILMITYNVQHVTARVSDARRVHYSEFNTSDSNSWYQRVAAPGPRGTCNLDGKLCANNIMCCSGFCSRGECKAKRRLQDLQQVSAASNSNNTNLTNSTTFVSYSNVGDDQLLQVMNIILPQVVESADDYVSSEVFDDEPVGTLKRVIETGLLRVGVPPMPIGVEFHNTSEPDIIKVDGLFVEQLIEAIDEINYMFDSTIEPEYLILPYTPTEPWEVTVIDYLYSDLIDMGLFVSVNNATKVALGLSKPIYTDDKIALVSTNSTDRNKQGQLRLGILRNVKFINFINREKPVYQVIEYGSVYQLRDALKKEEIHAVASMGSMADWYNRVACDTKCSIELLPINETHNFAYAFRQYPLEIKLEPVNP